MIADDLQQTLERYLSGAMSSDETRSFLARADVDQELRRLLDAERVITGAVARDLAATAPAATVPGDGLIAALEMSRVGAGTAATSWMTLKVAAVGVAIGLAGLVGGGLFVAPLVTGERPAPAVRTVAPSTTESPAVMPTPSVETGDAAATPSTDTRDVARGARAVERPANASGRANTAAPSPSDRAGSARQPGIDERDPASLPEYDDQKVPVQIELQKQNK